MGKNVDIGGPDFSANCAIGLRNSGAPTKKWLFRLPAGGKAGAAHDNCGNCLQLVPLRHVRRHQWNRHAARLGVHRHCINDPKDEDRELDRDRQPLKKSVSDIKERQSQNLIADRSGHHQRQAAGDFQHAQRCDKRRDFTAGDYEPGDKTCKPADSLTAKQRHLGFNDLKEIEVAELLAAFAQGDLCTPDFSEAYDVQRVVSAMQASAANGAIVEI